MKAEDITLLRKLTLQAEEEAKRVADKLYAIDSDYHYVDSFSFTDDEVVECTGINDWGDGTIEHVSCNFPYALLGASDEVIDAYIAERKQKELEAKQKHEQYVKAQEKRERRKQYEELKKEFEKA